MNPQRGGSGKLLHLSSMQAKEHLLETPDTAGDDRAPSLPVDDFVPGSPTKSTAYSTWRAPSEGGSMSGTATEMSQKKRLRKLSRKPSADVLNVIAEPLVPSRPIAADDNLKRSFIEHDAGLEEGINSQRFLNEALGPGITSHGDGAIDSLENTYRASDALQSPEETLGPSPSQEHDSSRLFLDAFPSRVHLRKEEAPEVLAVSERNNPHFEDARDALAADEDILQSSLENTRRICSTDDTPVYRLGRS
ncbi:hypothetical protein DL770_004464 [Monosporascus sp. CRB-9-2]|nr:hypothetical protein DL770_004464 [Monosporascus sp. CRB-9-2]